MWACFQKGRDPRNQHPPAAASAKFVRFLPTRRRRLSQSPIAGRAAAGDWLQTPLPWPQSDDGPVALAAPPPGPVAGALHAAAAAPGALRAGLRGQERARDGGGAAAAALPQPAGGAGRVGLGGGERAAAAAAANPAGRGRGRGRRGEAAHLLARHLAHGLLLPGGAVQPAPGRLLPVRAHVAPVADAVPGGRAQPAGRPARHAPLALPLRLLRAAPLRRPAGPARRRPQPQHGRPLRLADQQGDLLGPALPGRAPAPPRHRPHRRRRLRAELPAAGAAGAGGRVPQVPGGGDQGRAAAGAGRAAAAAARARPQPAGHPALPRPPRRAQLPPQGQAGAAAGEHPGAAEPAPRRAPGTPPPAAPAPGRARGRRRRAPGAAAAAAPGRVLPERRAGGDLPGLAPRPALLPPRPGLAAPPLHPAALRGLGAGAPRPAAPPAALRRPGRAARHGELRAQHDPRRRLLFRPALPHLRPGRAGGCPRLAGAAQPGAGAPGGGGLRRSHESPVLPAQRRARWRSPGGGQQVAAPPEGDMQLELQSLEEWDTLQPRTAKKNSSLKRIHSTFFQNFSLTTVQFCIAEQI